MIDKRWQTVFLNERDDFIRLDLHDKELPKRFMDFVVWWVDEIEKIHTLQHQLGQIGDAVKNYQAVSSIVGDIASSFQECYRRIDELFGEKTLEKYFRKFYEGIPDFSPGEECIGDFITSIASAISLAYKLSEVMTN
jgi:hypothetical protein